MPESPQVFTRDYSVPSAPVEVPVDVDLMRQGMFVRTAGGVVELSFQNGLLTLRTPKGYPAVRPWTANVLIVEVRPDA